MECEPSVTASAQAGRNDMLPRVSDMPAPAPLHGELTCGTAAARVRRRSGAGLRRPDRLGDRQLDLPAASASDRVPAQRRRPGAHRPRRGRAALQGHRLRTARRRHRHQRPVADGRAGGRRLAPHEPDPRDQPGRALGARAGRRGEGPAQRRAGRARPVLPAGALHLQPRHDRRHDQHRCQRPGLLPVRQDPRPRAGADDRAAGRHGLDITSAGGRRSCGKSSGEPTSSAPSIVWSTRSSASRRT